MKKIINLILFSICLFVNNLSTNAKTTNLTKPLICLEGTNYSDYLEYDGYDIIENNVNFNMPGKYHVTYENKSKEKFVKNVDVVSKNNLNKLNYHQISTEEFFKDNTYYYEAITSKYIAENYQYYTTQLFDYDNEESIEYFEIYYQNELIKKIELGLNNETKISKIILNNNNIYLIGTKKITNLTYDIYVMELTLSGEFIRDFYISGNKTEEVKDALIIGEYMYIIGISDSNEGYFGGGIDKDLYLFKIDYKLGIVRKSYNSNLLGTESVSNMCIFNDTIFYGYSYQNNGRKSTVIKKVSLNLELLDELDYGYWLGLDIKKIETDHSNIYLLMTYYDYELDRLISALNVLSYDLSYVNQLKYKFSDYNSVSPVDIIINDDIVSLLFSVSNKANQTGYSVIKLKDYIEILNVTNFDKSYPISFVDKEGNLIFTRNSKKISYQKINSVIVFDFGSYTIQDYNSINDYDILINSKKVTYDKEKSNIEYDLAIFGSYDLVYYFTTNSVDFIFSKTCFIKEDVNILNNETYDKDFRLYFNGIGYLNGELIESGYKVEEDGKYTLDLIGKDSIQKKYTFSIEDNSVKNITSEENKSVELSKEDYLPQEENTNIILNQIPVIKDTKINEDNYLMLIPIIIFTATLLCFFKIK